VSVFLRQLEHRIRRDLATENQAELDAVLVELADSVFDAAIAKVKERQMRALAKRLLDSKP
jgi:hypothetical protein